MNAKTPIRKTKTPASRSAAKPAPAVVPTKRPTVAPASAKTGKSATAVQSKASPRKTAPRHAPVAPPVPAVPAGQSKQARLISLLQASPGATIDQMMTLTGWQAHTVRGTLSGVLRKKLGLNVTCVPSVDSGPRLYRILSTAARA